MGNFSVNHYSRITVGQQNVDVQYLIDMAEIPTFQEMRQSGVSSTDGDPAADRYLEEQASILRNGLSLEIDGHPVPLECVNAHLTFSNGAGGLPTMKFMLKLHATLDVIAGARHLSYVDRNFPGRAGWKEMVIRTNGMTVLDSTASSIDRSRELTDYSSDALNSPPQQLAAVVTYETILQAPPKPAPASATALQERARVHDGNAPSRSTNKREVRLRGDETTSLIHAAPSAGGNYPSTIDHCTFPAAARTTPRSRFTELISTQRKLNLWILFSAGLIAAGLGALHALEPGHGKTIVAAYLVGSRGTARHAVLLGVVVTAAHTAGVYLLGLVTLYASRYIVPDQLYPWLGAISGLSVTGLGAFTLLKHLTGQTGGHSHAPGETHSHWFLSLFARGAQASRVPVQTLSPTSGAKPLSLKELCMLGVTGGIVPCPAALVVLLSAFSLHRIGFGLFLITAFSSGLALVLVTVGLVIVYGKRLIAARLHVSTTAARYLPAVSSGFMTLLGVGITVSAVASLQLNSGPFAKDKLLPFVTVILLGLLLGMRHSTDADHVVAVSTIVSRQGTIRSSASIGLLWGLGHTITIFLVGSAIIIFGVVIPPRLGLSMEFCVALMLILLGLLNLSGILRRITERFTRLNAGVVKSRLIHSEERDSEGIMAISTGFMQNVRMLAGDTIGRLGIYQTIRPFAVGLVHGLAGSAAVALLVLSTIKSPLWSTAYLLVFGLGTMAGMMLMTSAISLPLVYTKNRFGIVSRHLAMMSGFFSMAFGIFLVYHIGFVDGLFMSHAHWTPR